MIKAEHGEMLLDLYMVELKKPATYRSIAPCFMTGHKKVCCFRLNARTLLSINVCRHLLEDALHQSGNEPYLKKFVNLKAGFSFVQQAW